jgi:hypothetical protein
MAEAYADVFAHRCNRDGSFDSICKQCYCTIANSRDEADLQINEWMHDCDKAQKQWFTRSMTVLESTLAN